APSAMHVSHREPLRGGGRAGNPRLVPAAPRPWRRSARLPLIPTRRTLEGKEQHHDQPASGIPIAGFRTTASPGGNDPTGSPPTSRRPASRGPTSRRPTGRGPAANRQRGGRNGGPSPPARDATAAGGQGRHRRWLGLGSVGVRRHDDDRDRGV